MATSARLPVVSILTVTHRTYARDDGLDVLRGWAVSQPQLRLLLVAHRGFAANLADCYLAGFQEALPAGVVAAGHCASVPVAPPLRLPTPNPESATPLVSRCIDELRSARYVLTVAELVKRVPGSTRTVERAFAAALGCTVAAHIRHWQAAIRDHLLPLGLTLGELAALFEFADQAGFSNAVRRDTGETPTQRARRLFTARFQWIGRPTVRFGAESQVPRAIGVATSES